MTEPPIGGAPVAYTKVPERDLPTNVSGVSRALFRNSKSKMLLRRHQTGINRRTCARNTSQPSTARRERVGLEKGRPTNTRATRSRATETKHKDRGSQHQENRVVVRAEGPESIALDRSPPVHRALGEWCVLSRTEQPAQ